MAASATMHTSLPRGPYVVSFNYFGEATSLPVKIEKVSFSVSSLPTVGLHLVRMDLTVVNECHEGDVAGKLKLPLPPGATVCKFEFLRGERWYPATPVEAKKAKEVVYKEKEKGRSVAATSQVQGNVFEIEVSPLPYKQSRQCRLWYSHTSDELPFDFGAGVPVEVTTQGPKGSAKPSQAAACFAECFGETHFACYVPFTAAEGSTVPKRVCLLWDSSASQEGANHAGRFEHLNKLAAAAPDMRFSIITLGFHVSMCCPGGATADQAIQQLRDIRYDGGSDLSGAVPKAVALAAAMADATILFSDGMDNLNRQADMPANCIPVHCVVDQPSVSLPFLSSVALASGGQVLKGDYLSILRPRTLLGSITTDQSEEDFASGDDGFACCPDHKLLLQRPIGEDGLWLCGTRGGVRKVSVEVRAGSSIKTYDFDLADEPDIHGAAAPLLGYLFAQQQYATVERDGAVMGLDLSKVRTELALKYGFCSPDSSLLMLYEPEQFIENGIACPPDHPAHFAWKVKSEGKTADIQKGEIGEGKTDAQLEKVRKLAAQLQTYIKTPRAGRGGDSDRRMRAMQCEAAPRSAGGGGDSDRRMSARRCRAAPQAAMATAEDECEAAPPEPDVFCSFLAEPMAAMAAMAPMAAMAAPPPPAPASPMRAAPPRPPPPGFAPPSRIEGGPSSSEQVVTDCETYVAGKEQDYIAALTDVLRSSTLGTDEKGRLGAFEDLYLMLRKVHGSSPSFFLYSADVVMDHAAACGAPLAARIASNCLELNLQDVQMMRSVGYFLVKANHLEHGLAVLERVQVLAPSEPQSYLDQALGRTLICLKTKPVEAHVKKAVELVSHVINHAWADRFAEIEWPALVLLHILVNMGLKAGFGDLWPLPAEMRTVDFELGLMVWLGWDTDKTDIDLHVVEPNGNTVYYSNNRSEVGGHLSKDFTQGYGPEVYIIKDPPKGSYTVKAKYYASHQQSTLTGATSAVIWALQPCGSSPTLQYDAARLDRNKEIMEVMKVDVA